MSALQPGDHYVAMGSSFAAGARLRPRSPGSPRRAQRSSANYAHLVAGRLGLHLTDVSWSGSTAASLLTPGSGRPAQIDSVNVGTRLVTITSGGNDLGYISVLFLASLPSPVRNLPAMRRRFEALMGDTEERLAQLPATWDAVLSGIHARAPEATVVLVDYLTLMPPSGPAHPLAPEAASWGRTTAQRLSEVTAAAAQRHGGRLVAASTASRDHHAWSSEPWTDGFKLGRNAAPYHPNYKGMQAVADLVLAALDPPTTTSMTAS